MKKIVIIDDEPFIVNSLQRFLIRQGYNIFSSTDVYEGLNLIKNFKPNLIIMDLKMPKMNGFEAIRRIREQDTLKEIPVVVITGLRDMKSLVRLKGLGVNDYIIKPYYPDDLLKRVKIVLGEVKTEETIQEKDEKNLKQISQ